MKGTLNNSYTALQRHLIDRLADIEQSDADACAGCGGEDCACCEIYLDRQRWAEPHGLFDDDDDCGYEPDGFATECEDCGYLYHEFCEVCGLCEDCCNCTCEE